MTISSTDRKAGPFAGDGSTTVFPYAFKVFATSDLYVVKADSTGAETVLALTTHYTATMNGNQDTTPGGNVTLLTALAVGETLIVTTQLGYLQGVALTNQGGFYPTVINSALDRLVIYIQQLSEQISRTLKVAITSPDGTDVELPSPVAYNLIGWNAAADGLQNVDPTYSTALYTDLANTSDIAKGDAMIGFKQSGTGAVARTAHDKLGELVSVKDFGAVGDGATDDTAAIQAAINYCVNLSNRKQTLYFPANNAGMYYKVTSPLVITGRLNIVGDGQFSTRIQGYGLSSGQYVVDFDCLATDVIYHCGVSNIAIGSNNGLPAGIRLKNVSYMLMKQVWLYGLGKGVYITGTICFSNFFEQVTAYSIADTSIEWENFTGGGQYMFNGCTFTGTYGVTFRGTAAADSITFNSCNWEQCTSVDLYVIGSVYGLSVNACRSEGLNGLQSFRIDPSAGNFVYGLNINGCFWTGDTGTADPIYISGIVKGFTVAGNYVDHMGFNEFVFLNGAGLAGIISGNYCTNSPAVVNSARDGVVIFSNYNSSGKLPEYWGLANWNVNNSTFTATATGMTTSPTGTVKYSIVGTTVTIDIPGISGTSNATTFTLTGAPNSIWPSSDKDFFIRVVDNGTLQLGLVRIKTTGVIELYAGVTGTAFTASGTKQVTSGSLTYILG